MTRSDAVKLYDLARELYVGWSRSGLPRWRQKEIAKEIAVKLETNFRPFSDEPAQTWKVKAP
jgi:hypothetical protein